MLIKCPECKKDNISSEAKTCPSCGYPLGATVIEATGKEWKKAQLLSVLACVIGIIVLISGHFNIGFILLLCGFVGFVGARVGAWWHHG